MIRLATVEMNSSAEPMKRRRNARPGGERDHHGRHHDDQRRAAASVQRAAEVADRLRLEQAAEPVQRDAVHREGQAAIRPLERQHQDGERRAVEEQHEQREEGRSSQKRGPRRPVTSQLLPDIDQRAAWRRSSTAPPPAAPPHWPRPRDIAAARCRSSIISADRGALSAAHQPHGDEVAHHHGDDEDRADGDAGLAQRHDDVRAALPAEAPPSSAASSRRRSMRIMVLKIGVTMNSV